MGQKSNPNSFQQSVNLIKTNGSYTNSLEYATLTKDYLSIRLSLSFFFEKSNIIIKDCFFILNNEKSFATLFISFLVLKRFKKSKNLTNLASFTSKETPLNLLVQKVFTILSKFGYLSSKRLVFQNLNKLALTQQRTFFLGQHTNLKKKLNKFSKEIFFEPGIFLFCLMNTTKQTSPLISKFIARFFKIFHRSKKLNKFLSFLYLFVDSIKPELGSVKGLKIQIKGRFNAVPRSKIMVFEKGSIPLQTISTSINYSLTHINTSYGVFGVKVWIFE
jgi:hypothetical protein